MDALKAEIINRDGLNDREADVLVGICEGLPNKVIARKLDISIKTVEAYCGRLNDKFELNNEIINHRCAVIASAIARGLIRISIARHSLRKPSW